MNDFSQLYEPVCNVPQLATLILPSKADLIQREDCGDGCIPQWRHLSAGKMNSS